ncbi:helix-loop-helix DNA-binding domain-containing protein, partial [Fennellomyces sp. T-0311]
ALFLNFTSDLEPHVNIKTANKPKKTPAFKVNGVNLLNRKNVDSKTAIERIQRRRENHNHVERRRRDNINNTILELSRIVPNAVQQGQKLNKGKVLKMALDHILVSGIL